MTTRTFGEWLLKQKNRDDPVGDLARDFIEIPTLKYFLEDRGLTAVPREEVTLTDMAAELYDHQAHNNDVWIALGEAALEYLRYGRHK